VDVFSYSSFENEIRLYANFAEEDIIVIGSKSHGFITTFLSKYRMIAVQNEFPVIMHDESGSKWNVFGEAMSGPHQGERLTTPPSYFASRWAFDRIFKDLNIIEN
jgi:hypothetical protein